MRMYLAFSWTPSCCWKGPMNKGLSVLPYGSFLGIGSIVFSVTQHGVRGPYGVLHNRQVFRKKYFFPQNGENDRKMSQK